MKSLTALASLLIAACAAEQRPLNADEDFEYGAMGHDPFWTVAIGDDSIVLTLGPEGGSADGELRSFAYPRALPREQDGVRRWESGDGTQVIAIEARRQPCEAGGWSYRDRVTIYLSGRTLEGCGGKGEPMEGRG